MSATILVVEDSPDVRELLVSILTHSGYTVTWALNGQTALTLLHADWPDLILLDLSMPIMRGALNIRSASLTDAHSSIGVVQLLPTDTRSSIDVACCSPARNRRRLVQMQRRRM